jgi:hypothetical protein
MVGIFSWDGLRLGGVVFFMVSALTVHGAPKPHSTPISSPKTSKENAQGISASATQPVILDSSLIRKFYMDGEFEPAIEILEKGLKENRKFNHNDSVFIYKHLGVMHAARFETREKGKYYMHQLLMTEPTAKIMDMYASDMIYMIFKNIQEEFESNRVRLSNAEGNLKGNTQTEPDPSPASKGSKPAPGKHAKVESSESHAAFWWIGGLTAATVVTGGFYFYAHQKSDASAKDNVIVAK